MKKLSENKKAYLLAAGIGVTAGIGTAILMNVIFSVDYDFGRSSISLLFGSMLPISILIFLFILFKKIPVVWENIKTRIFCLLFLLFAYIFGFYLALCIVHTGNSGDVSCFLLLFLAPIIAPLFGAVFLFINPTKLILIALFYSSIPVAIISYLMTKEITNLSKRIVLFFIIGFVVYIIAVTPLITMSAFY